MIYCFSGTGNSLRVARELAGLLHERLSRIDEAACPTLPSAPSEAFGLVFPVYAWGLPLAVENFLNRLPARNGPASPYIYGVLTCGDDIGRTDSLLRAALAAKGYSLRAVYSIQMRNTYVCLPGFDTDSPETERAKLEKALKLTATIAARIARRETTTRADVHPGSIPRIKSYVLRPLFNRLLTSDRHFHIAPDKCTLCHRCIQACPLHNLVAGEDGSPRWQGNCTHCLACYHACPRHAIAYGKFTQGKGQVKVELK